VIRNRDRQVPSDPRPGNVDQNAPQQSRREPRR
jgi:hypothetical protein